MRKLLDIMYQISEWMGIIINEFYPEEIIKSKIIIIISIIGIILFISLVIYSRIKSKETEAQRRKKAMKKKENEKTPD